MTIMAQVIGEDGRVRTVDEALAKKCVDGGHYKYINNPKQEYYPEFDKRSEYYEKINEQPETGVYIHENDEILAVKLIQ